LISSLKKITSVSRSFTIDKNKVAKNILVQGKPVQKETIYYVGTNDYLSNGGDNMNFFKKSSKI
jgi:2',3'-cyclic-nucleotide 2'-phosphodiesterase (5'-nucleotidase family)